MNDERTGLWLRRTEHIHGHLKNVLLLNQVFLVVESMSSLWTCCCWTKCSWWLSRCHHCERAVAEPSVPSGWVDVITVNVLQLSPSLGFFNQEHLVQQQHVHSDDIDSTTRNTWFSNSTLTVMTSTQPLGTLGSATAIPYQESHDRNHKLSNVVRHILSIVRLGETYTQYRKVGF
jgi:hypothetical protein